MFLEIRQTVLDACHELADRGFLPGTGGNIALRASNEIMAITPSGTDYYTMSPEDICLVEFSTRRQVFGELKPSVELGIHMSLLEFRKDFLASIHTHQPTASALTLLGKPLRFERADDQERLGQFAPLVPYRPSGTGMLAKAFAKSLRPDASVYLLRNHGIVCGGETMPVAIENVERLERAARELFSRVIERQPIGPLRTRILELLTSNTTVGAGK